MPSKGSPRITVRINQELLDVIDQLTEQRNQSDTVNRPWNRSDWIVKAIIERIAKTARGRGLKVKLEALKCDENMPREIVGDINELWERNDEMCS